MAGRIRDTSAKFPASVVRQCSGLAVDIGGSAVKIFYRSNDDYDAVTKDDSVEFGTLHYLTCGRPDLSTALDLLRNKVHLLPEAKVYSTGIGGFQFRKQLREAFQTEMENVIEGDCLVEGLKYYMQHVPESELIYPPLVDVANRTVAEIKLRMELHAKLYEGAKNQFFKTDFDLDEAVDRELSSQKSMQDLHGDDLYPCLVVHLGSSHGWLKLEKDGTPKFCETTSRGGRCYLGMASLLTGANSYDEFIDLAEKGNNLKVDQSIRSLGHSDDKGTSDEDKGTSNKDKGTSDQDKGTSVKSDAYQALQEFYSTQVAFSFGGAVGKSVGEFKREDLALAWLLQHLSDVAATTHHAIVTHATKHVFVAGSLANRELVRKHLTRELLLQDAMMVSAYGKTHPTQLYFLKNGGHLCSTGAMLNSINKFSKQRESS